MALCGHIETKLTTRTDMNIDINSFQTIASCPSFSQYNNFLFASLQGLNVLQIYDS